MKRRHVTCVTKSDRYNPHERILGVGGISADGPRWYATQHQAISWIVNSLYELFVRVSGRDVRIIVAVSRYGNQYLKTEADGEQPNNLLSLSECS